MKHLVLGVLALLCIVLSFLVELRKGAVHTASMDYLAGGLLLVAIGLAAPMQLTQVVNTLRRILPWADRRSAAVPVVSDHREAEKE